MTPLGATAAILAALVAVGGGLAVALPGQMRAWLAAFPRQPVLGWVLTTVVLVWCGHLLYFGPLGFLEPYRGLLFILVPVAILLVGFFVDELLTARALGGLLILLPSPMLEAARWNPSSWRYVVIALAYAMAISGATLVTIPYMFRKVCECVAGDVPACRRLGVACLALALVLAVVALRAG